jgi:hypothetical protein
MKTDTAVWGWPLMLPGKPWSKPRWWWARGEVNAQIPFTFGDTIVPVSDFDLLVKSTEPPTYFKRWPVSSVIDKVAANIAQVIEDGDCISFFTGSLFEALGRHLVHKRHLGIHSPYFTDAPLFYGCVDGSR